MRRREAWRRGVGPARLTELLRQAAQHAGLLDPADAGAADGATSEAATAAIEALLEQSVSLPDPSEEACRRYHAAHEPAYRTGERVRVRHILFAVTPGVDVVALRKRAEMRCGGTCFDAEPRRLRDTGHEDVELPERPPQTASSVDPAADCAPVARELLGLQRSAAAAPGAQPIRLHLVEGGRRAGVAQPVEAVHGAVRAPLRQQTYVTALRQYLQVLAGNAEVEGVDLAAADTPLVQ